MINWGKDRNRYDLQYVWIFFSPKSSCLQIFSHDLQCQCRRCWLFKGDSQTINLMRGRDCKYLKGWLAKFCKVLKHLQLAFVHHARPGLPACVSCLFVKVCLISLSQISDLSQFMKISNQIPSSVLKPGFYV